MTTAKKIGLHFKNGEITQIIRIGQSEIFTMAEVNINMVEHVGLIQMSVCALPDIHQLLMNKIFKRNLSVIFPNLFVLNY